MERSRRLREAREMYASSAARTRTGTSGRFTLPWVISHVRKLLVASQSWFVVSIVGELTSPALPSRIRRLTLSPFLTLSPKLLITNPTLTIYIYVAGAGIGANAAIISIITEWLSDVKMGYCSDGWWLNQQFCCWELDGDEDSGCESWHLWSTVTVARWFIYVLFAVRLLL